MPDELRSLAVSKGKLFSQAARAHRLLLEGNFGKDPARISDGLKKENIAHAGMVVESMDEISLIYQELDHYKATGKILGTHPVFKRREEEKTADGMSDAELLKASRNLPSSIHKYRKERIPATSGPAREHLVAKAEQWERKLQAVRAEIKKRNI